MDAPLRAGKLQGAGDTIAKTRHQAAQCLRGVGTRLVAGNQQAIGAGIAKRARQAA